MCACVRVCVRASERVCVRVCVFELSCVIVESEFCVGRINVYIGLLLRVCVRVWLMNRIFLQIYKSRCLYWISFRPLSDSSNDST